MLLPAKNSKRLSLVGFILLLVLLTGWQVLTSRSAALNTASSQSYQRTTFDAHRGAVFNIAISSDGRYALSGSGRLSPTEALVEASLRYWDVTTGREIWHKDDFADSVYGIAFMPDGRQAVVSTASGEMFLIDLENQRIIRRFEGHTNAIFSVDVSADGTRVVSGSGDAIASVVGFNRDAQDKTVRVWDITTGALLHTFSGHELAVMGVKFHPLDHNLVYSASADGTVRLWNIATGAEVRRFDAGSWVSGAAMSLDGQYIAAATGFPGPNLLGSQPASLVMWDAETGAEIRRFQGHSAPVISIGFSPDGTRLISGGHDKTIRIWDAATGTELEHLQGHLESILFVRFIDDARTALSSSQDGKIYIWPL